MRKNFIWAIVLLNLILLPTLYWLGHPAFLHGASGTANADLPVYGQMPDFKLTQQDGKIFDDKKMRGHIWLADFMFTRCPNQCPMMSVKFGALQGSLPSDVRLVSFSVDPEHDDTAALKNYAGTYGAKEGRWIFLTGETAVIHSIMSRLHLGNDNDPNMHSLRFVLLDKDLRVRGYYDSTDSASLDAMKKDVGQLRKAR